MEINGLANIAAIVQMAMMENTECHTSLSPETASKILKQLDLLERYMLQYSDDTTTYWHSILEAPDNFPTLRERVDK